MSNEIKMSEAPRFFVGPEDTEINAGHYRHFFHHADEDEEEEDADCYDDDDSGNEES